MWRIYYLQQPKQKLKNIVRFTGNIDAKIDELLNVS